MTEQTLTNADLEKALTFLQKGRYDLNDAEPFIAFGSYRLAMVADEKIPTLCTDGQSIFYNPKYVLNLRTDDLPPMYWAQSEIEHESWHAMLGHCKDWKLEVDPEGDPYDPRLVNSAQDYVINNMIRQSGRHVHPTWLCEERFAGMSWREVYMILKKERKSGKATTITLCVVKAQPSPEGGKGSGEGEGEGEEEGEGKGKGKGSGKGAPTPDPGPPEGPSPAKTADGQPHNDWDQIVVEAAEFAQGIGRLPGHFKQFADKIRKPDIDWRPVVARWFSRMKRGDYTYRRPNRKYLREGLVLPSPYSYTANLVVFGDSSGSMWRVIRDLLSEVYWIGKALGVPFDLVFTDTEVYKPHRMKRPDDLPSVEIEGGGGTDFCAAFDWLRTTGKKYDAAIFFTDGWATYPERRPAIPVLWVVTHDGQRPPWGEVLMLPANPKRRS